MQQLLTRLSFAAILAAGFCVFAAGCDSGPKGAGQDAIQTMPAEQKDAYEERMKAMKGMKGAPMAPGGGPVGPGAGAPPGPPQ